LSHVTTTACAVDSSILVNSLAIWAAHNLPSRLYLRGNYIDVALVYHSKSLAVSYQEDIPGSRVQPLGIFVSVADSVL